TWVSKAPQEEAPQHDDPRSVARCGAARVGGAPSGAREGPAATSAPGFEACQAVEQGSCTSGRAGARTQGDRPPEGFIQPPGRCTLDDVRDGDQLREPEPPRASPHLHDEE